MDRRQYRSFNIREVAGVDDFAAMAEAVTRRYRRLRDEGRDMPDLVLIDGGVGQLNAATAALDSLGVEVALAALAKREELIWLPWSAEPVRLDRSDPAHLVLRRVRDEAHRFAVSRHRGRRRKTTLSTELLGVPGIGPGRAQAPVHQFRLGAGGPEGVGRGAAASSRTAPRPPPVAASPRGRIALGEGLNPLRRARSLS